MLKSISTIINMLTNAFLLVAFMAIAAFSSSSFAYANEPVLTALQKTKKCVVQIEQPTAEQWNTCLHAAKGHNADADWVLSRIETCYDMNYIVRYKTPDGKTVEQEQPPECSVLTKTFLLNNLLNGEIALLPKV